MCSSSAYFSLWSSSGGVGSARSPVSLVSFASFPDFYDTSWDSLVSFIFLEVEPSFDFPMGFGFGWGFSDDLEIFFPLGFGPALLFLTFLAFSILFVIWLYLREVPLEMAVFVTISTFEWELLIV